MESEGVGIPFFSIVIPAYNREKEIDRKGFQYASSGPCYHSTVTLYSRSKPSPKACILMHRPEAGATP